MKIQASRMRCSSTSRESSPYPITQAVNMKTPSRATSPGIKDTCFLHCDMVSSAPLSLSSSALVARRVSSRPQSLPRKLDLKQPVARRYYHPLAQFYGPSLTPPLASVDIVSPTVIAARYYYLNLGHQSNPDTPPPSGSEIGTSQQRFPSVLQKITQTSGGPRRHSVAIEPYPIFPEEMNALGVRTLEISRRGSTIPAPNCEDIGQDTRSFRPTGNRNRWMQNVFKEDNDIRASFLRSISTDHLELPAEAERRIHNPLDPRYLGNIPFSYTTNKLREWGDVYLYNIATADAFIRAIGIPTSTRSPSPDGLRRSLSDFSLNDSNAENKGVGMSGPNPVPKQLVKVKVVPHCRDRKPFFMQKSFPIRKPATSPSYRVEKHPRYHLRHRHEEHQGTRVETLRSAITQSEKRPAVPIHIEYALYRTPLLAAVLLCEHVKKGDTVEIPLPFPEAWEEVVEWVYTGNADSEISAEVREIIEYLGGRI